MVYLVVEDQTNLVVVVGSNLEKVVTEAFHLGYFTGYVTNQDGGRGDLESLITKYGLEEMR